MRLLVFNALAMALALPLQDTSTDTANDPRDAEAQNLAGCGYALLESHHPYYPTETPGDECRTTPSPFDWAQIRNCHCMFFK